MNINGTSVRARTEVVWKRHVFRIYSPSICGFVHLNCDLLDIHHSRMMITSQTLKNRAVSYIFTFTWSFVEMCSRLSHGV